MEKQSSQQVKNVFSHFDVFNLICDFLTLKDKLTMSSVSKLNSFFLEQHFSHILSKGIYDRTSDKTMRQLIKYNFNRNLKIVKIPSILSKGKEESTYYNYFKHKCITRIQSEGKHLVAFVDNKNQAYLAKVSQFITAKFKPNISFQILKDVKRVFCKGERLFSLNIDGTVSTATIPLNSQNMYKNLQIIQWTLRVPVVNMTTSKNYAVFLLGTIKSSQVKKLILGQDVPDKVDERQTMKIIAYNSQTQVQYIINYPFKQVKSFCVGSNTAYFVNEYNQLIQCILTNLNQGQKQLTVSFFPHFQNKKIITIFGGLNFFIALNREENLLQNWNNQHVIDWLRKQGFDDFVNIMRVENVNGQKLINMDKKYMQNVLGITNTNLQQKILLSIEQHRKISYKKDKLFGWGKNETGQLGNNMAVFVNKPVNIKLPQLNKNENIVDIKCGWFNSILITNQNRVFITTQDVKKQQVKEKQQQISDEQLKEMDKKERRRKKTDHQEQATNTGGKKDKKKKGTIDQKQIEKQKQKYEQQPHWLQYKSPSGCFSIGTCRDIIFQIQLAYKQQQTKKKIRTIKAILDKIEWDPNINKQQYKIGYMDKYMGTLDITVNEYLKSEVKEHRILYFKRNGQVVWHKEDKIDLI